MAGIPMVDLAQSPAEVKEDIARIVSPVSAPRYPYGCAISLDDDTLKKLDLDGDLPQVGEMIYFQAVAKVTCASANERETGDGKKEVCRRVELQIVQMGVQDMDPADRAVAASSARRKRFYDHDEPDGDEE